MTSGDGRYPPIEQHGVIGDGRTVALVSTDGCIDWFCPQRFDAPSLFAALLDADRGGGFTLAPVAPFTTKQIYLPDTPILITRFFAADGVGEVMDFMPVGLSEDCAIVRRVEVVRGEMRFRIRCRPAFDYGRAEHRVEVRGGTARFTWPGGRTDLTASVDLRERDGGAEADLVLGAGQRAVVVLHPPMPPGSPSWDAEGVERQFARTRDFWRHWLSGCRYRGRWREMVNRSALTLKLLTYAPTGAVVAAATTSLPETVGGPRNWDYRYSWLRDSAFTIFAFIRLGFREEAARFLHWLEARCAERGPDRQLQIVYGIAGEHDLAESELPHLEGYRGSRPVRIGNAASDQLQLDIYGELMDAVYLSNKQTPISYDLWRNIRRMLDWLADNWRQPDEGIWEVRGGRRHFVYSRLMCWVAFERALRIQNYRGLPADSERWRAQRDAIYEDIMANGWDPGRGTFVQYYGGSVLDASNLLMPLVKFVGPTDPRILSTLDAVQRDLVSDSLVYRYDPAVAADDGLGGGREGSFSLCSFWLVECLTRAGRLDEARLVFEKMLSYANHLGLYAEQIGDAGEALGNFPQAFTHLGLISAAYDLDRALGGGAEH